MLREELQQRLAKDYSYAVTKMQGETQYTKKLFYFSVLFSEAQRVLNWEWNRDLALIYTVTQYAHTQISATMQVPRLGQTLPIDLTTIFDKLTQAASDLAAYLEKTENEDSREELCLILGRIAEIVYIANGNGSYLYEKGFIKFESST